MENIQKVLERLSNRLPKALQKISMNCWLILLLLIATITPLTHTIYGALSPIESHYAVEIEGSDYGRVDEVRGLPSKWKITGKDNVQEIVLKRSFLTQPSLSQWAKNSLTNRANLKTVELIERTDSGRVLNRWTLKSCQPLSWSVETQDITLGGYHEVVKLAVQEIY